MSPRAKAAERDDGGGVGSLKRLGGGRWQTRDGRFTIEPQSGTWAVVDSEQTDELGLPLVRGPYRSLTEAKEAIGGALAGGDPASPLAGRLQAAGAENGTPTRAKRAATKRDKRTPGESGTTAEEPPPTEPRWLIDLPAAARDRARGLIERLTTARAADPDGIVRQDLVGGIPSLARFAIAGRLADLIVEAAADKRADPERLARSVADLLAAGADRDLGQRWRLVDGEDRPIELTAGDVRAALDRLAEGRERGRR